MLKLKKKKKQERKRISFLSTISGKFSTGWCWFATPSFRRCRLLPSRQRYETLTYVNPRGSLTTQHTRTGTQRGSRRNVSTCLFISDCNGVVVGETVGRSFSFDRLPSFLPSFLPSLLLSHSTFRHRPPFFARRSQPSPAFLSSASRRSRFSQPLSLDFLPFVTLLPSDAARPKGSL